MTKPGIPTDLRATMKLLGEAQLERLEAMDDAELDDALRARGIDPDAPIDVDKLLAKLPADADGNPPAGILPFPTTSPRANASSPPRFGRAAWIAAAALAAAIPLALYVANRAGHGEGGTGPVAQTDARPDPSGALARAASLRDEAARACHLRSWKVCRETLDEARRLDPAGESQDRVVLMREAIARSGLPPEEGPAPPGPRPDLPRFEAKPDPNDRGH
jgi:hypothetical protein